MLVFVLPSTRLALLLNVDQDREREVVTPVWFRVSFSLRIRMFSYGDKDIGRKSK